NGRLAVDIGGVHCARMGRVVLGDENSDCSEHNHDGNTSNCSDTGTLSECAPSVLEEADDTDDRFGLTKGSVYEIVLFHAERHTTASNFKLTLAGFLAPRSICSPTCGDELVAGGEECDDGTEDNTATPEYGKCTDTCELGPYCGDGEATDGEICDNGVNTSVRGATEDDACAPGCVL